jgi:hypothetical protein
MPSPHLARVEASEQGSDMTWASACPAPDQCTKRRHVEAKENVAPLTADSMRLTQILLNLSNAFTFTKEGK